MRKAAYGTLSAALVVALAGCGSDDGGSGSGDPVVVATTTQLGDIADDVAQCAGGSAQTLMGAGDDPHTFALSSNQLASMVNAEVLVINGLGLEGGMQGQIDNAIADGANVLEIAPQVDPIPFGGAGDDHAGDDHADDDHGDEGDSHAGHNHGDEDPHVALDVARMAQAAVLIGDKLAEATGDDKYAECGQQVSDDLTAVDEEVTQILSAIPAEDRILITDHEAFGYFADAYDFEIAGVVIPGGSTDAEPSSAETAAIVNTVKEAGVPAIFSNSAVSSKLVDAVAGEVGDIEAVQLYVDSLGPEGSGAETYADMMTTNARLIADALS